MVAIKLVQEKMKITSILLLEVSTVADPLFIGIGGRYKVSKKISVNSEYFYALSDMLENHQNMLSSEDTRFYDATLPIRNTSWNFLTLFILSIILLFN
ncbi:DUF5777 family beta-barrel protein [bacterium]|nr:DUF5777 family beta-barrel protein [bacterium]